MARWRELLGRGALGALLCASGACYGSSGKGPANPFAPEPPPPDAKLYPGDADGPPRAEGLPECDVPRESLSDDLRRAWLLSEEALAVPPPAAPESTSSEALSEWSATVLSRWISQKSDVVMAAADALNEAAEQGDRERIVAGALLGLVYEDVARTLVDLPMPEELDTEPEVAEMYREVMVSNAKPYLVNSQMSYEACAGNAKAHDLLRHWGRYCAHRAETLPGIVHEAPPSDTTEVTVERE